MRRAISMLGMIWRGTRYLWLIMLSGGLGALLSEPVGTGIVWLTGEPKWAVHLRCASWTLFVLLAAALALGAPSVIERFWHTRIRKERSDPGAPPAGGTENQAKEENESTTTVRGLRAVPAVCLIGGFVGLIVGSMLSGMFLVVYFFLALSPLARDGWWPVLSWAARGTGDGFTAEGKGAPSGYIFLIIFGLSILAMIAVGFAGSWSSGRTRYEVLRSKARR